MRAPWLSLACLLLLAGLGMAAGGQPEPGSAPIPGFTAAASARERGLEERMVRLLDPASTARHFRVLTEAPHPSGSERNRELADYVRDRFVEYGLEEVAIHRYDVLLPLPRKVAVSMVEPQARGFALKEDGYPEDKDSYAADVGPTYLGMSASGDVTAEVIYAHSGDPGDYDWLAGAGDRSARQDRHRPLLRAVQLPGLQGLGGRAARGGGPDHLLRPDGRRLPPRATSSRAAPGARRATSSAGRSATTSSSRETR